MRRLSRALLPGSRKRGGPLSCKGGQVRGGAAPTLSIPGCTFSLSLTSRRTGTTVQGCGPPGGGPAPLRPAQSAPERRVPQWTEAWAVAKQRGDPALGVPPPPKAPGPAWHLPGPLEGRRGRNAAEDLQGCLWNRALSLLSAAGSGDLGREERRGEQWWHEIQRQRNE